MSDSPAESFGSPTNRRGLRAGALTSIADGTSIKIKHRRGVQAREQSADGPGPGTQGAGDLKFTVNVGAGAAASISYHGGPVGSGLAVQLIFWSASWDQQLIDQRDRFAISVERLLATPYMSALAQYGVSHSTMLPAFTVTSPEPPSSFNDGDVAVIVWGLIEEGFFPHPEEPGGNLFYCVVMPPGTNYTTAADTGVHQSVVVFSKDHFGVFSMAYCAWIGFETITAPLLPEFASLHGSSGPDLAFVESMDIDTMTRTFAHELVETCTDPEADGWYVDSLGSSKGEIGDLCNQQTARLKNGVFVEAYWSEADAACIIPTNFSLRRIYPNGVNVRSQTPPAGSLRGLIGW